MAGITVFNRNAAWKRLVLGLNVDKYYRTDFGGDECWMLYLKPVDATDTNGDPVTSKIISTRYRRIDSRLATKWTVSS